MEEYLDRSQGQSPARRKERYLRRRKRWFPALLLALLLLAAGLFGGEHLLEALEPQQQLIKLTYTELPQWVDQQIIPVDGSSRRGEDLEGLRNIVIHYVGNPGTTAQQNRDWYADRSSSVSSHFLVGLQGEVIMCIPLHEKSSATNWRNGDTISIEVCHRDESGEFGEVTYDALVRLTAWLAESAGMGSRDVIRHYDVTGKDCPRYFVRNSQAWEDFLRDVDRAIQTIEEEKA